MTTIRLGPDRLSGPTDYYQAFTNGQTAPLREEPFTSDSMRYVLFCSLMYLLSAPANAQSTIYWERLRNYAEAIGGVDVPTSKLCPDPDSACLVRCFTEVAYGHTPRHMSYQGVPEQLDTARITRLVHQFLAGTE